MNEVQARLKELRAAGWTLAAIADRFGVDWTTVRRWENGETAPPVKGAVLIALDVLGREEPPKRKRYKKVNAPASGAAATGFARRRTR